MTTAPPTAPSTALVEELRHARQLAEEAHRDTARIMQCLEALARPVETPEAVLAAGLEAMADAFEADLACLVRTGSADSTETPRDVAAFTRGFPHDGPQPLPDLPGALATPHGLLALTASWSAGADGGQLVVDGVEVLAGARLAPAPEDPTKGSVLLLRHHDVPFTPSEVQVLASLSERLLSAARDAESRRRSEVLARAGERLGAHRTPLSSEVAEILGDLTGSTWSGVVELDDDGAAALVGGSGTRLAAESGWPSRRGAAEADADLAQVLLVHDAAVGPGSLLQGAPVRSVLRVPVLVDGAPKALLYAVHTDPGAFSPAVVDAVCTLAGSTANALESFRLHAELQRSAHDLHVLHGLHGPHLPHRSAALDPLTGLADRALLLEELERRLAQPGRPGYVGVLVCDLDGFKSVNDHHGHDAGDQLLQRVAHRMAAALRPDDLLARVSGDEFVVVVDGLPSAALVAAVGERLLRAVGQPVDVVGASGRRASVAVGGCFGGVFVTRGGGPADQCAEPSTGTAAGRAAAALRDAEAAMSEAKRAGGHRVRLFDAYAAVAVQRMSALDADLARALREESLEVHYQPVWDLVEDRAIGVEALARWRHETQGWISPEVFVPLAERSGAVVALGSLVLRRACSDLVGWGPAAAGARLSVNASPVELRNPEYATGVLAVLADHGLASSRLVVEVTEGLPLGGPEVEQLQLLRRAGVRVVVDDFGVSHSDLARLKSLPVDGLKIDRSLVSGLSTSPDAHPLDSGLVEAILVLARAGRLSVVAEGLETADERAVLVSLGCRHAQGWLTGRPVPAFEVPAVLTRTGAA